MPVSVRLDRERKEGAKKKEEKKKSEMHSLPYPGENVSGSQQTTRQAGRKGTREVKSDEGQGDWSIVFELPNYFEFRCFLLSCSIGILPSHGGTRVHTVCHVGSAVKL